MEIINYVCSIGEHFIGKKPRIETYREGMKRIHLQERALLYRLLEGTEEVKGLRHIDGVTVYVDTDDITMRDLIVAMGIDGVDFTKTVAEYQKRGVTVYERVNTSIYSKRIVEAIGIEGAIRVSPLHCHGVEDIDKFLKITAQMVEDFKNN
jgi:selenocysteine lyase/cysteine desulfurase